MFCIVRLKIVLFKRVCVLVFLQNAGSQLCFGFFFIFFFHGETCHHSQARVLIDCSWHTSLLNSRALRVNQNQAERIYRSSHFALLYFALLFNDSLTNRHRPQHHSSRENYDIGVEVQISPHTMLFSSRERVPEYAPFTFLWAGLWGYTPSFFLFVYEHRPLFWWVCGNHWVKKTRGVSERSLVRNWERQLLKSCATHFSQCRLQCSPVAMQWNYVYYHYLVNLPPVWPRKLPMPSFPFRLATAH